jgi:carbamoyltransferase
MGMAALGDPDRLYHTIKKDFFVKTGADFQAMHNLHRGCKWWNPTEDNFFDIAAATQRIYEEFLDEICLYALKNYPSKNVVLMGGCALNCVANSKITHYWDNVWIMPNPGDAGSSVGAVLAYKGDFINWPGAFLGHNISGEYPVETVVNHLSTLRIVGVANGRAEFGPRALGNRSLLADPRGEDIKDLVNQYKKREPFRPFAPAILEEYVHDYFDIPVDKSPYMQFVGKCKYPDKFPAIIHYDGTSRVQTVSKEDNPGFRKLLERWYELTGCPMLLNTSLNVKGEPLVNTREDAQRWTMENNLPVVCLEE